MSSQNPFITVIIPVYNGAQTLQQSIEAALASLGESAECIVVNDCSTDASRETAMAFQGRVRVLDLCEGPRGPAHARNRGAELARGQILFFVDSDVVLACGALQRLTTTFRENARLAAVFGSYDASPAAPGLISQYRNLLHHFVHQNGNPNASTFWAGCGAIRKEVFEDLGGFDETRYSHASIEDIELGYRLKASGYSILLDKELQGTHLKSWNLKSLIKTDISHRARPWSRLILERKNLPNDLNLRWPERINFVLVSLFFFLLVLALWWPMCVWGAAAALSCVAVLNRNLYAFFFRQRGAVFAAGSVLLHMTYYLYSGLTYLWVWAEFQLERLGQFTLKLPFFAARQHRRQES